MYLRLKLYFIIILVVFIAILFNYNNKMIISSSELNINSSLYSYDEQIFLNSLFNQMSNLNGGIYTNLNKEDILSESQGILLSYFIKKKDKKSYDYILNYTLNNFLLKNNLFIWRKGVKLESTNALIDDFRILNTLIDAHKLWPSKNYDFHIKNISTSLLNHNTYKNYPVDFFDINYDNKSNFITLSYIDLSTMKKLSKINPKWNIIYENSIDLILNSKINNSIFYHYRYDLNTKKHVDLKYIDMIQNVYVLIHLKEVGHLKRGDIEFLYDEFKKHKKLYTKYSIDNFTPYSNIESTALYSLVARLFFMCDDFEVGNVFLKEATKFQIKDSNSKMYYLFGHEQVSPNIDEFFSFDNLQFLYSISYLK